MKSRAKKDAAKPVGQLQRRRGPVKTLEAEPSGNYLWFVHFFDTRGRLRRFADGVDYSREMADNEAELAIDRFLNKYPDAKRVP